VHLSCTSDISRQLGTQQNRCELMEAKRKIQALPGIELQSSIPYPVIIQTVSACLIKTYLAKIEEDNSVLEEFRKC